MKNIVALNQTNHENYRKANHKWLTKGLLFSGILMTFSGLLIQINYHVGNSLGTNNDDFVWGLNRESWSLIHQFSGFIFSVFMISHISKHLNWYKVIIKKKLFTKQKQTLILSMVFILVSITGYIP